MNKRITRLGIGLIVCYLLLFLQLNRLQVGEADKLNHHPENFRAVRRGFARPRGWIASADGVVVAHSVDTQDDNYARLREYPGGELFAQITGFLSLEFGNGGGEKTSNDQLAGLTERQQVEHFSD